MNTTAWPPTRAESVAEERRARLERLSPADGLAFGLTLAESRRLLAYVGFSLYRESGVEPRRLDDRA